MSIITLTTDFGTRDQYVGAIKGVIAGIAPKVSILDITHDVPPHDVAHAAFVLREIWPWYPPGTIHLAIVDPGVGSARRVILARYENRTIIAPDNGLITWLHRTMWVSELRVLENERYFLPHVSNTFHGRDVMAPAAAHLAAGVRTRDLGRLIDRVEVLPFAHRAERTAAGLHGRVVHVDRFGTMVTNISRQDLFGAQARKSSWSVKVNDVNLGPIRDTFADVEVGQPLAIIGSAELLEIAVNRGSATERFGPADGVEVLAV